MTRPQEMCPYLKFATEGQFPPVVCRLGFSPKLVKDVVYAGIGCDEISEGLADKNCRKTGDSPLSGSLPITRPDLPRMG